uniref:Uncharacterized protein n=1 Tax=Setaria italica TaxID=4555 RepID=K4ANL7_SETIT
MHTDRTCEERSLAVLRSCLISRTTSCTVIFIWEDDFSQPALLLFLYGKMIAQWKFSSKYGYNNQGINVQC